ncbi:MAG: class I SAM-dependent methyltransferase [Desulfobacterales bacterium]|nr:class I SAM-dependent methyltransferase [Desulfobacterales bacterium]
MRPDDLVEFSRQTYARENMVEDLGSEDLAYPGLHPDEQALLESLHLTEGRLLLLGVGGGREAIPLARMGFEVTGVDFVPEMVEKAKANAARHGVQMEGLVQEISKIDVSAGSYDCAWLSAAMYSCVPTRGRRIEMLQRIGKALMPGGYFICQFRWDTRGGPAHIWELVRKIVAFLTLGNLWYEKGDTLPNNIEFIHAFSQEDEVRSEFAEGGFEVLHLHIAEEILLGGAVLRKTLSNSTS